MVANKFMCNNIMIKNKTLPMFERNGIYNLKKRKYKNIDTLVEYNMKTQVLSKNVRCGSLWDSIKSIFKKGKNFVKKTMDFIDNSPILSTVKDIASDYVQEKTGINPNDYYNITKDVVNMTPENIGKTLVDTTAKTLTNQYNQYKERKKNPSKTGKPSKRDTIRNVMTDYKNNMIQTMPQYKSVIDSNYNSFSQGLDDLSAGALNIETWKKKGPLFLISQRAVGGKGKVLDERIKEILRKNYKLTDFKLTPTMNKLLASQANGRLYQGRGDEVSSGENETSTGKKNNAKYLRVLNSLK